MNGHTVLFTNFSTLPGNSNFVTVAHTNVKDRIIVVDKESFFGEWVERKGSFVSLGQRHDIVHTRVGGRVSTSTLSNIC